MRFAYIDSHGNEVPIPSVDALALRIQLGAISPDTQLYDVQADHWAPACTHEIFHSLSRDSEGEGFVPPPPPVVPPSAAPQPPRQKAAPAVARKPAKSGAKVAKKEEKDIDMGLTLAEPPPDGGEDPAGVALGTDALVFDMPAVPTKPATTGGVGDAGAMVKGDRAAELAGAGSTAEDADEVGFDFGDLGGGLQMEDAGEAATPHELGADMALETGMEFAGGLGGMHGGDDLQLERPMSEFAPDSPPGWMEAPETDGDVMDFSAVSAEVAEVGESLLAPAGASTAERSAPRARPSPPRFKRQRSLSGPIVVVVGLLAIGVGGYVGWPILQARRAERSTPRGSPVVMPAIAEELLPQMRSLAEAAMADAVEDIDENGSGVNPPSEPDEDWLAGAYLGNASQFASVEVFWLSIGEFVDGIRAADWQLFHDKYVVRVEAEGVPAETAPALIERADSGFVAAAAMRAQTYAVMDRLVDASLGLHDFLLQNEDQIDYQPANTSTVDPVLEAVPSTPELGEQMWDMVDGITDALDALGSLDRVTRDRLKQALVARLQQVGIQ